VEKCRFLSSQVAGYLEDDAWLSAAKQANSMATRLSEGLAVLDGVTILQPVEINMVFVEMPKVMLARLEGAGYEISLNAGSPDAQGVTTDLSMIRFRLVTSWAMSQEDVDQFISVATAG
jgi:threonine aldolase